MNRNHVTYWWKLAWVGVVMLGGGAAAWADVIVFSDSMNYADNPAIQAAWLAAGTGSGPARATNISPGPTPISGNTPAPASGTFMSLGNGVRYRELGTTLTNSWTLELKMLMSTYSRSQRVYLLNAAGTEGYGLEWGSNNVNQFNGNGSVTILRFNDTSYTDWNTFDRGTALTSVIESLHAGVTGYAVTAAPDAVANNATYSSTWADMANVKLTWDSTTNVLTLFVDGNQRAQVTDANFSSFSRIYLRGNSNGYFDEVTVTTVPEPGAMGLITAAGGVAILRRARGDHAE